MIKTDTGIITIAVEHHPAGLTTGFPCHFQRFHGEPAVRRERHGPVTWGGDWYNNRRLLERLGHTPPAEAEKAYYASIGNNDLAA